MVVVTSCEELPNYDSKKTCVSQGINYKLWPQQEKTDFYEENKKYNSCEEIPSYDPNRTCKAQGIAYRLWPEGEKTSTIKTNYKCRQAAKARIGPRIFKWPSNVAGLPFSEWTQEEKDDYHSKQALWSREKREKIRVESILKLKQSSERFHKQIWNESTIKPNLYFHCSAELKCANLEDVIVHGYDIAHFTHIDPTSKFWFKNLELPKYWVF